MSPEIKVIQPSGLLDRTKSSEFSQKVTECVNSKPNIVLINFQDVTFMDSSGLGAVVLAIKTVEGDGIEIYVCSLKNQLKMLFELSGLDKVIKIFDNKDEFDEKVLSKK